MSSSETDWRRLDGEITAWFDAPSLVRGAELAGHVLHLPGTAVDLRPSGVRIRVASDDHGTAVSAAARELGLTADPAALQRLDVVVESTDPAGIAAFWHQALDRKRTGERGLTDPLRRDPTVAIRSSSTSLPLRNRIHLDAVRPAPLVEQAGLGEASGPYGVRHVDPDGNEVDLVPGGPLGDQDRSADWQVVFGAMACYRVTSPDQQRDLAATAASLADRAGFPLLIDLRPGLLIMDSGKDQADADAHGLPMDFVDLAANLQAAARDLGAEADPRLPRFLQIVVDATDVTVVRGFWVAALGYEYDRRAGVTDIYDPRRLNPVLVFQRLDASETERRRQRNRLSVALTVPSDVLRARVDTCCDAGGRIVDRSGQRWQIADPEGNELMISAERPNRRVRRMDGESRPAG